jgi:protein-L-isoaspartate(D-aspartate) O-methyltransferase
VNLSAARERMINTQLVRRGIVDPAVLTAFGRVPREQFVTTEQAGAAYEDRPLPIGAGQTISQPYIVALTCELLQLTGKERVLEIGTGSGYAAAILSELATEVFSVERLPALASAAAQRLQDLGYHNVTVRCGDGTLGWPEHAPYDAIAVAAGAPEVPNALLAQLATGGRLVIPVGSGDGNQQLLRVTRIGDQQYRRETISDVRFVRLIGEQGWREPPQGDDA